MTIYHDRALITFHDSSEILTQKADMAGAIFCDSPETVIKIREELLSADELNENLIILPEGSYREVENKNLKFIIHYDTPESLGSYSQTVNYFSSENAAITA